MTDTIEQSTDAPPPAPSGGSTQVKRRPGDVIFATLAYGAGVSVLILLAGVAVFLFLEGIDTFTNDITEIEPGDTFLEYTAPLLFGTIWASFLALLFAFPPAICVALFISHYAPPALARSLGAIVDLLAAIPSVVYGLWGIFVVAPALSSSVFPWLEDNLGFLPFFAGPTAASGRTMFTAAVVLAIMILPIITAISREVFLQTPRLHEEAAMALGATRWEVIKMAVFPYGRSAVISGAMLGLGRALGETMAVAIILSPADIITFNTITTQNPNTIAANIALKFPESSGLEVNRLVATGLVLFVVTLLVNSLARYIVNRRAAFSGAN